jgi:hypothetical protein
VEQQCSAGKDRSGFQLTAQSCLVRSRSDTTPKSAQRRNFRMGSSSLVMWQRCGFCGNYPADDMYVRRCRQAVHSTAPC